MWAVLAPARHVSVPLYSDRSISRDCVQVVGRYIDSTHTCVISLLHWLDIPQRVQYKLGVIVQQCLQNKAPQYLVDCCKRTSDVSGRQRLRSANRCQLIVPRHRRSMFGRRAFSVAGPMEWNSLPDSLRDPARSTDSFRSALKTYLFAALRDDQRIRGTA